MLGQLSKGQLSKETFVHGDYCPRKTIVQGRTLSKETFAQGDNCPRRRLSKGQLSKETFVQVRIKATYIHSDLLGHMSPWTKVP